MIAVTFDIIGVIPGLEPGIYEQLLLLAPRLDNIDLPW
jgi:hypothetical protein